MIPKRIFQTFSHKSFEPPFQKFIDDWKIENENFEYIFYDDDDSEYFIRNNFPAEVYDAYIRIIPPALKADLWRYCVLYTYGGFYADIDIACLGSLERFVNLDTEFVTPIDLNIGDLEYHNLYNAFIGSIPKHPILKKCIDRIVLSIKKQELPRENLMNFAGPGCLGIAVNEYLKRPPKAPMVDLHEKRPYLKMTDRFPLTTFNPTEAQEPILNISRKLIAPRALQGKYSKVDLIKFEQFSQYIRDLDGKKILQNKGGLLFLEQCYKFECQKVKNYVDWGQFGFINVPFDRIVKP
jgi:hypothetical protein